MQNLIIDNCSSLYDILEEISSDLNFKINFVNDENSLNDKIKETEQQCNFDSDIINTIDLWSTSTCRINSVYVGDISLYVFDNNTLLG